MKNSIGGTLQIMETSQKHLKKLHERNEHMDQQINKNNPKFEIGQLVIVKNHTHHTFKPKYLLDYKIMKILSNSTLLLVMPNGMEIKQMSVI